MSGLQSLLSHPAVMRLGWALIHFLWQGAAVATTWPSPPAAIPRSTPARWLDSPR